MNTHANAADMCTAVSQACQPDVTDNHVLEQRNERDAAARLRLDALADLVGAVMRHAQRAIAVAGHVVQSCDPRRIAWRPSADGQGGGLSRLCSQRL